MNHPTQKPTTIALSKGYFIADFKWVYIKEDFVCPVCEFKSREYIKRKEKQCSDKLEHALPEFFNNG